MGINTSRKFKIFEQEVARSFRRIYPNAWRGLQYRTGRDVADVEVPDFWIECKRGRLTQPRQALAEALAEAPTGRWPLAVCKDDYGEPFVTMRLQDFLQLLERGVTSKNAAPRSSEDGDG